MNTESRVRVSNTTNTPPCPSWCRTPAEQHGWDIRSDGTPIFDHDGPQFGDYISTGRASTPGGLGPIEVRLFTDFDLVTMSADDLRKLAADATAAAAWSEAQQ